MKNKNEVTNARTVVKRVNWINSTFTPGGKSTRIGTMQKHALENSFFENWPLFFSLDQPFYVFHRSVYVLTLSLIHPDCQSSMAFFRLKIINAIDRAVVINPLSIFFPLRFFFFFSATWTSMRLFSLPRFFGGKKKGRKGTRKLDDPTLSNLFCRGITTCFFAWSLAGREIANWLFIRAASTSRRFIRAYVSVYYARSVCVSKGSVTPVAREPRLKNDSLTPAAFCGWFSIDVSW